MERNQGPDEFRAIIEETLGKARAGGLHRQKLLIKLKTHPATFFSSDTYRG